MSKQELIDSLTTGLSDTDLDKLVATIELKLESGLSYEEVHDDFINAIYGTVEFSTPDMDDEERVKVTMEIANLLIDRLITRARHQNEDSDAPVSPNILH